MKKNLALTLGAIYMLFFAIPFPMLLYYNINDEFDITSLNNKDPWLAVSILALSVILWLILLIGYFKKWLVQIFITKRNLEKIKSNGLQREARIINSVKISKAKAKYNSYELELAFKNLSDTEITHKTFISDSKPHERRFETGKRLNLLLNRDSKKTPHFIIATTRAAVNYTALAIRIVAWLLLTTAVVGYYFYSYQKESMGMGWRFMSFGHPLIVCPAVLLFYRFLTGFVFRKLIGVNNNSVQIKFRGLKTWAKVIKVSQTGAFINEQPVMRFELEYTDNKHQLHTNSLKRNVGMLELELIKQKEIEIFYLPENPEQIAFVSDLNNLKTDE